MSDKDSPENKQTDERADEEFERVLRNLVNTPHKPHEKKAGSTPKGAPPKRDDQ